MGRVPNWDEVHGWHEFAEGGSVMGGEGWCDLCDWPEDVHVPKEKYDAAEASHRHADLKEGDAWLAGGNAQKHE